MVAKKKEKEISTVDQQLQDKKLGLINILNKYLSSDKFKYNITTPKKIVIKDDKMLKEVTANISIAKKTAKAIITDITVVKTMLNELKDVPLNKEKEIQKQLEDTVEFYEKAQQNYRTKLKEEQDRLNTAIQSINNFKNKIISIFETLEETTFNLTERLPLLDQYELLQSTTDNDSKKNEKIKNKIATNIINQLSDTVAVDIIEVEEDNTNYSDKKLVKEVDKFTIEDDNMYKFVCYCINNNLPKLFTATLNKRLFNEFIKENPEITEFDFVTKETELK